MSANLETYHFINGEPIRPENANEIGFKIDWTGDPEEAELTVDRLILSGKAKSLVKASYDQFGITRDIPYTIQVGTITLEYVIKVQEDPLLSDAGDSRIEVNIIRNRGIGWFKPRANNLSFLAVNKTNPISVFDVPYLIVKDNQLEMLILLGISVYTLTKALIEGIRELITLVTAPTVQASVPNVGVPPSMDLGDIIALVLKIVAQALYLAAIILALIDLTKQIIELLFPPIRNFKASKWKELMTKGCANLGFTFESTLLDTIPGLTVLPIPLGEANNSIFTNPFSTETGFYTLGYPTEKDSSIDTLGKLIDVGKKLFNADFRVSNGVVRFERRDYWQLTAGLQIKNTLTLQDELENRYELNHEEWWKRYVISYQTDGTDTHTLDKVANLTVELGTEILNSSPLDAEIGGTVDIRLPFSFATRKKELTFVEKEAIPFAKLADDVVQFFGGTSNLVAKIQGRIGVTQISQQYFLNPKLMYTVSGKQPPNYLEIIGAPKLWDNYHVINNVRDNIKRIYDNQIPISTFNFESVIDNNYVYDQNGNLLELLVFDWINENKVAETRFAIPSNEADNTQTIRIN